MATPQIPLRRCPAQEATGVQVECGFSGKLLSKIDEWQRRADYSLASQGMTLLLSGFTPTHSKRGIELVDARGEPYVLKLLIQRSQIALVEQELGFADELLNQVEHLLTSPDIPDRNLWAHRLYLARGRRHTAGFRYDNAIKYYNDLLKFVPESVWANDPVFLHSWAVACRGVRDYRNAKALISSFPEKPH